MPMFRKKPVVIEAHKWVTNGDHPDDDSRVIDREGPTVLRTEGKVVRHFRRPNVEVSDQCSHCSSPMLVHGWIKTLEGGHIVCPGDWIITGVRGEYYPCKPDIFLETYEEVNGA